MTRRSTKDSAREAWNRCPRAKEYKILDEDGVNMGDASVKRCRGKWIYQDNVDGFEFITATEAKRLRSMYGSR